MRVKLGSTWYWIESSQNTILINGIKVTDGIVIEERGKAVMDIDTYQEGTEKTAIYRQGIERVMNKPGLLENWLSIAYCTGKLNGESGEIAEQVFKALRDDGGLITPNRRDDLFKELGDVMWYVSQLCTELGFKLENVMDYNLSKLQDRKERGVLGGSGDLR